MFQTSGYFIKALQHAFAVANIYPRGSASGGEAHAAEYVRQQLSEIGIKDIRRQPFTGLRSIWLYLAMVFGAAVAGHAAYWLLSSALGGLTAGLAALVCFGWAAWLAWRKFTFGSAPLETSLPRGASQNIIGVIPAQKELRRRVVVLAHLDAHRAAWVFASDALLVFYPLAVRLCFYGLAAAPLLYLLAALSGQQVFAWLALPLTAAHFMSWFTGMTADLGPYSPGANDNASSVGVALSLAERLQAQPLEYTQVWLAFTGCEETGCGGMLELLQKSGAELKEALFIGFEMVGIGDRLAYVNTEGLARRRQIDAEIEKLVLETGGSQPPLAVNAATAGAFSEIGAAWEHGFKGVCLSLVDAQSGRPQEWHRLSDRPERLQQKALEMAHSYTWNLLQRIDQADG